MYNQIAANKRKTWLIMALFAVIIGALGWIISNMYGSPMFFYLAFIVGGVYALMQYFFGSQAGGRHGGSKAN